MHLLCEPLLFRRVRAHELVIGIPQPAGREVHGEGERNVGAVCVLALVRKRQSDGQAVGNVFDGVGVAAGVRAHGAHTTHPSSCHPERVDELALAAEHGSVGAATDALETSVVSAARQESGPDRLRM